MEKNESLVKYKKNFFSKIKDFILSLFGKEKSIDKSVNLNKNEIYNSEEKLNLFDNELLDSVKEKERILNLKLLYDNGQIDADEISDEDVDKIVELYEEETRKLNEDTKKRLNNIERMMEKRSV